MVLHSLLLIVLLLIFIDIGCYILLYGFVNVLLLTFTYVYILVIFWDTLSSAVLEDSVIQCTEYTVPEHSLTVLEDSQTGLSPYSVYN